MLGYFKLESHTKLDNSRIRAYDAAIGGVDNFLSSPFSFSLSLGDGPTD